LKRNLDHLGRFERTLVRILHFLTHWLQKDPGLLVGTFFGGYTTCALITAIIATFDHSTPLFLVVHTWVMYIVLTGVVAMLFYSRNDLSETMATHRR